MGTPSAPMHLSIPTTQTALKEDSLVNEPYIDNVSVRLSQVRKAL